MSAEEPKVRKVRVNKPVDPLPLVNPRGEHTATAVNHPAITRNGPYRTGDGDTPIVYRPGSQDFLKHPSRGNAC